jgi:uncharacterized coiled-coil protein SlyX
MNRDTIKHLNAALAEVQAAMSQIHQDHPKLYQEKRRNAIDDLSEAEEFIGNALDRLRDLPETTTR